LRCVAFQVHAFEFDPHTGACKSLGYQSAEGTSTCYLTVDQAKENLLLVNYWDASVGTMPINPDGSLLPVKHMYHPPRKEPIGKTRAGGRAHSDNDAETAKLRQAHPHTHSIVLDPVLGRIAFAPDLGMDVVRQFVYTKDNQLVDMGIVPAGPSGAGPLGPRYIEFHPTEKDTAYVINELASLVSVFCFDLEAAKAAIDEVDQGNCPTARPLLHMVQTVSTIPPAFPQHLNTCGRINVHPSGRWVIVSNRGHDSVAVLKTHSSQSMKLSPANITHTVGATPRHFMFDKSGEYLFVANQDTDNVAVFKFNQSTGTLGYTGQTYRVASPNFVQLHTPAINFPLAGIVDAPDFTSKM